MKKKIFYIVAGLSFLIILITVVSLNYDVSYWSFPLLLMLACLCLLGLLLTKSRWTVPLMLLMFGLGISVVIFIMATIHGG